MTYVVLYIYIFDRGLGITISNLWDLTLPFITNLVSLRDEKDMGHRSQISYKYL